MSSAPGFKRCTDGTGEQEPHGCLFIHGDVKEGGWRYCQAPRRAGSSYCEEHHALTHHAAKPRRSTPDRTIPTKRKRPVDPFDAWA